MQSEQQQWAEYCGQWELMRDVLVWLDLRLYFYYVHHQWLGPSSELRNLLGRVVTREEFEHQLSKASLMGLEEMLTADETAQLSDAQQAISLRLRQSDPQKFPLLHLFERCQLDAFEQNCVILAYAAVLDRKYEKLLAYLQDDMTRTHPDVELAVQLFLPKNANIERYRLQFWKNKNFAALFGRQSQQTGNLELDPLVLEYLASGTLTDHTGWTIFDGTTDAPEHALLVQQEVAHQLDKIMQQTQPGIVCLSGAAGSGKRFQIKHLLARCKARGVFVDLASDDWQTRAEQAALAARLLDAHLCLYHLDEGEIMRKIDFLHHLLTPRHLLFLLSRQPVQLPHPYIDLALNPLEETERVVLFAALLKDVPHDSNVQAEELAVKFHFTPRQIVQACRQAREVAQLSGDMHTIDSSRMHEICYRQVVHKLDKLAHRVRTAYTWTDVVLPAEQKQLMQQACDHIRYRNRVYYQWGFAQKISYGRGLSLLFSGAPGTGKTMCAQVIARQLNMELYQVDLSQIVSKYIGETEKNLQAVFAEARNTNGILFFDECDALFGKRSAVKDAHDRSANIEVAYLLQQIEAYDGVCILATNLIGNIDEAFLRRITYVVHFPFPDTAMRAQIYRQMIPTDAPLDEDIDWDFLARTFELSGGHIKNIVLVAAFLAARDDQPIGMRHLLRAAVGELKKSNMLVVREQLREYADLLDDSKDTQEGDGS